MLATQWAVGQVFLMTFAFFLFVLWIWLMVRIGIAVFADRDLSGWAKAAWVAGLIVFPFITVIVYLIVRGGEGSIGGPMSALSPSDAAIDRQIRAAH